VHVYDIGVFCVVQKVKNMVEYSASHSANASVVSLNKILYAHCLVLVGIRNIFDRDVILEITKLKAL